VQSAIGDAPCQRFVAHRCPTLPSNNGIIAEASDAKGAQKLIDIRYVML
jgi:hypothetical protein